GAVAEAQRDVAELDAELVGGDLRERRREALSMRARARRDDDAAARLDRHLRALPHAARTLDVERVADTVAVPGREQLDRLVEAALVVTGVVRPPERRLVGELVGADQVAAAELDGIELELA